MVETPTINYSILLPINWSFHSLNGCGVVISELSYLLSNCYELTTVLAGWQTALVPLLASPSNDAI